MKDSRRFLLLPGLDGTGKLFEPFLDVLPREWVADIVDYPQTGKQSYDALHSIVEKKLPDEPFVIVAESFSGPLAFRIAAQKPKGLIALVVVATFLRNPLPELSWIPRALIRRILKSVPISSIAVKTMLCGMDAEPRLVESTLECIRSVAPEVIVERVFAIFDLKRETPARIEIPTMYIRGRDDKLVGKNAYRAFDEACSSFRLATLWSPHFVLQRQPRECTRLMEEFLERTPPSPAASPRN